MKTEILADSITTTGHRITTFLWTYERFIHPQVMSHKMLSTNASSSRAKPTQYNITSVDSQPVLPIHWGHNQAGMIADEEVSIHIRRKAYKAWLNASKAAVKCATTLNNLNVHKQVANRLLEPFNTITVVVTATEWDNFFTLRCQHDAQPEINRLARTALAQRLQNTPKLLHIDEWHLPLLPDEFRDYPIIDQIKSSVAACARTSYLNHDMSGRNMDADIKLYDFLEQSKHLSPLGHQATPMYQDGWTHKHRDGSLWSNNLKGWVQYRDCVNE